MKRLKRARCFLDFLREPEPAADGTSFNLQELDDDVIDYSQQNHALLAQPLARLTQMNPLAIRLYQMHGQDPQPHRLFTLNNQHLNGGIEVDIWGRTSLTGCYAAGENAGTHWCHAPEWSSAQCRASFRPPLCITYCSSEKP
ncbi:hypothetical protein DMI62_03390 [Escherichia coli]|nr:hypothetical protein [Escherichia coli]